MEDLPCVMIDESNNIIEKKETTYEELHDKRIAFMLKGSPDYFTKLGNKSLFNSFFDNPLSYKPKTRYLNIKSPQYSKVTDLTDKEKITISRLSIHNDKAVSKKS